MKGQISAMDVESESYEAQQSPVLQQTQHQQFQCEQPMTQQNPMVNSSSPVGECLQPLHAFDSPTPMSMETAIPLPPPPSSFATTMPQSIPAQPHTTEPDVDSLLLQQFSCLGTTDHEDLISQFHSLMNNQTTRDSARFFLEMSNWNLQTAVGCYLDYCSFQTLPSMKIIQKTNSNEQNQAWRLLNDGTEDWPRGCYLTSPNQAKRIELPMVKPGKTCDITAEIYPNHPATMWRLCTPNGSYFGETIWMIPPGSSDTAADLTRQMSQMRTTPCTISEENLPQVNVMVPINME